MFKGKSGSPAFQSGEEGAIHPNEFKTEPTEKSTTVRSQGKPLPPKLERRGLIDSQLSGADTHKQKPPQEPAAGRKT